MPSGDWEMNVFLNELAAELTEEDLKTMKHLLTGYNGSGKGVLELIKDPIDLFQHLRERLILTRDNIVCLQAMLWHTGRKDLHNKFVKFAKKQGNIVHFFVPSDKPENGYEYIKVHISGREKMNRNELELRMLVSQALCIPLEFVIASGIEATNSIMVTFMVAERYANLLSDLDNKDKEYLGSKGVDAIWYNGQLINCIEIQEEHMDSIALDKKKDLMAAIFGMWERTLIDKERQILIKKYVPPTFVQKSFKDTGLLEYLWALRVPLNPRANFQEWILTILVEIKRTGLYDDWMKQSNLLIKAYTEEGEDIEHEDDAAGPGTLDSETPSKMTTKSGLNVKGRKGKHIKQRQAVIESPTTLEAMNERLKRIEAIVERNVKMTERFTSGIPEYNGFLGKSVSGNKYDISKLLHSSLFTKV